VLFGTHPMGNGGILELHYRHFEDPPHAGWLKHVKLTSVAGSYWRADASREQLVEVLVGRRYLERGGGDGQAFEDWLQAEQELKRLA